MATTATVTATPTVTTVELEGTTTILPPEMCRKECVWINCNHRVLTRGEEMVRVVPKGHDLLGIRVDVEGVRKSPELQGLSLRLGARSFLYWDRETLLSGEELLGRALSEEPAGPSAPTPVVPISRSHHHTDLVFHYDANDLEVRATYDTWEAVADGEDLFEEIGDECLFRVSDNGEVHRGTRVVHRNRDELQINTSVLVKRGSKVYVPGISVSFAPSQLDPGDKAVSVPFWQRTEPVVSEELREQLGMRVLEDGATYARNEMRFSSGSATLWKQWKAPRECSFLDPWLP
jgi:hypothetical protein